MSTLNCLSNWQLSKIAESADAEGVPLSKIFAAEILHRMIESSLAESCPKENSLSPFVVAMAFYAILESECCPEWRDFVTNRIDSFTANRLSGSNDE